MSMNSSEAAIFKTTVDKLALSNRALGRLANRIHKQRLKMRTMRATIEALRQRLLQYETKEVVLSIGSGKPVREVVAH